MEELTENYSLPPIYCLEENVKIRKLNIYFGYAYRIFKSISQLAEDS